MNVALVVPGGVDRSGEYRVIPALLWLVKRLTRLHHVRIISLYQERRPSEWELHGATVINVGHRRSGIRALMTIVREHRRVPFDVLHAIFATRPGVLAVAASRILGVPALVHLAGGEMEALRDIAYGGCQTWRGRLFVRSALKGATRVTAASGPMVEAARSLGRTVEPLPLGIDLAEWPVAEPRHRDTSRPARLVHVGSLNRVKDQHTALRAAAILAGRGVHYHMDFIGVDTLSGELQQLARDLGLSARVAFHGFLPHRWLRPLVTNADLHVVSSRHEAGPVALLEAAVAGVPTVGTAVGHVADWAPEAAVAVPVADHVALAAGIAELLQDESRRLSVAREAQRRAVDFDADATALRVTQIYEDMVRTPCTSSM